MSDLLSQIDPAKLRSARLSAHLEQKDIAAALGVSVPQISNIESGYSRLQSDHLPIWAKLCGIANPLEFYTDATPNAFRHARMQSAR